MKTATFIASGCAAAVRTGAHLRGGFTGAMRTAHPGDSFLLRAEVHGPEVANRHLRMSINNTTYDGSLIDSSPVRRPADVDSPGHVHAPTLPGVGFEEDWVDGPPGAALAR